MRQIIFGAAVLLLLAAGNLPAFEGDSFGLPLTLGEPTAVSEIEKSPESFVGKRILITGTVVEVCAKRGCWLDLASDTPFEKIQVKVTDGVIVFPMSARGRTAHVEGIIEKIELSEKEALEYRSHQAEEKGVPFDPAAVRGPQTIYRLKALGAVIEK